MPTSQKKRERKLAKQRKRKRLERKEKARRRNEGIGGRLARAARAPLLHTWVYGLGFEPGKCNVVVSRLLQNGQTAFAVFMLDLWCLGAKDVAMDVCPRSEYEERLEPLEDRLEREEVSPEYAVKLIQESVRYARGLGFPPHADYRKAAAIFGDIDPSQCEEEIELGKDGKPCFVSGPYDSPQRCREIQNILTANVGPDGFDFIMMVGGDFDWDEENIEFLDEPEPTDRDLPW